MPWPGPANAKKITDRSGSHLGAASQQPGVTTGLHFGHHKGASPAPADAAGLAQTVAQHNTAQGGSGGATMSGGSGLTYFFPSLDAFIPNTMNVYANAGGNPPPAGQPRTANVNILIVGTPLEGTRQRIQGAEGYSHVILCDTQIEVHDSYQGNTAAQVNTGDILQIPAGVANYWIAIVVFVLKLPNIGRKKVILADRRGTVGDFTKIL